MKRARKSSRSSELSAPQVGADNLFQRVSGILNEARLQTVRSLNTWMVTAYWLISREIVEVQQGGRARAGYGAQVLKGLSARLTDRFGKGYSVQSLENFRNFFLTFEGGSQVLAAGSSGEGKALMPESEKSSPAGRIFSRRDGSTTNSSPAGRNSPLFHPNLSWSHYRALKRVEKAEARLFYEQESIRGNWSKRQLERQIGSLHYERLLLSKDKRGFLKKASELNTRGNEHPLDVIKDPYALEFLNLPESHQLSETELETALIVLGMTEEKESPPALKSARKKKA